MNITRFNVNLKLILVFVLVLTLVVVGVGAVSDECRYTYSNEAKCEACLDGGGDWIHNNKYRSCCGDNPANTPFVLDPEAEEDVRYNNDCLRIFPGRYRYGVYTGDNVCTQRGNNWRWRLNDKVSIYDGGQVGRVHYVECKDELIGAMLGTGYRTEFSFFDDTPNQRRTYTWQECYDEGWKTEIEDVEFWCTNKKGIHGQPDEAFYIVKCDPQSRFFDPPCGGEKDGCSDWRKDGKTYIRIVNMKHGAMTVDGVNYYCSYERGGYDSADRAYTDYDNPVGGRFVEDLDSPLHEAACGEYRWTGTRCCGEQPIKETSKETYEDSPKACYESQVVQDELIEARIAVSGGEFYLCGSTESISGATSLSTCGSVVVGSKEYACMPNGFVETSGGTILKEEPGIDYDAVYVEGGSEISVDLDDVISHGCCAANQCWVGNKCVNAAQNTDDKPLNFKQISFDNLPGKGDGYRCIYDGSNADWSWSKLKYNPDRTEYGWCPRNDMCFLKSGAMSAGKLNEDQVMITPHLPSCVEKGEYTGDYVCVDDPDPDPENTDNAIWATRTNLIAERLESFAEEKRTRVNVGAPYSLVCGDYDEVLNYVKYGAEWEVTDGVIKADDWVFGDYKGSKDHAQCYIVGVDDSGQKIRRKNVCGNNVCLLRYREDNKDRILMGVSLNQPPSNSAGQEVDGETLDDYDSVLHIMGRDVDVCSSKTRQTIGVFDGWYSCDNVGYDVLWDEDSNLLVFGPEGTVAQARAGTFGVLLGRLGVIKEQIMNFFTTDDPAKPRSSVSRVVRPRTILYEHPNMDKLFIAKTQNEQRYIKAVFEEERMLLVGDKEIGDRQPVSYFTVQYTGDFKDMCESLRRKEPSYRDKGDVSDDARWCDGPKTEEVINEKFWLEDGDMYPLEESGSLYETVWLVSNIGNYATHLFELEIGYRIDEGGPRSIALDIDGQECEIQDILLPDGKWHTLRYRMEDKSGRCQAWFNNAQESDDTFINKNVKIKFLHGVADGEVMVDQIIFRNPSVFGDSDFVFYGEAEDKAKGDEFWEILTTELRVFDEKSGYKLGKTFGSCSWDGECAENYYCDGVCKEKKDLGLSCDNGDECSSGSCVSGICCGVGEFCCDIGKVDNEGVSDDCRGNGVNVLCDKPDDKNYGVCMELKNRGETCRGKYECITGVCDEMPGICCDGEYNDRGELIQAYECCLSNGDCVGSAFGTRCSDEPQFRCVEGFNNGVGCGNAGDCLSGKCQVPKGYGTIAVNTIAEGAICYEGTKACKLNSDCEGYERCDNDPANPHFEVDKIGGNPTYSCVPAQTEGDCDELSDCLNSHYCEGSGRRCQEFAENGVCDGTCELLKKTPRQCNGEQICLAESGCDYNAQCATGICNDITGRCCGEEGYGENNCCADDGDCPDRWCDLSTYTCAPLKKDWESCESDSECESKSCDSDAEVCCPGGEQCCKEDAHCGGGEPVCDYKRKGEEALDQPVGLCRTKLPEGYSGGAAEKKENCADEFSKKPPGGTEFVCCDGEGSDVCCNAANSCVGDQVCDLFYGYFSNLENPEEHIRHKCVPYGTVKNGESCKAGFECEGQICQLYGSDDNGVCCDASIDGLGKTCCTTPDQCDQDAGETCNTARGICWKQGAGQVCRESSAEQDCGSGNQCILGESVAGACCDLSTSSLCFPGKCVAGKFECKMACSGNTDCTSGICGVIGRCCVVGDIGCILGEIEADVGPVFQDSVGPIILPVISPFDYPFGQPIDIDVGDGPIDAGGVGGGWPTTPPPVTQPDGDEDTFGPGPLILT